MSVRDRAALWDRLRAAGMTTGDAPSMPTQQVPWYVRTMIGVAGWIAAVFLLIFVALALDMVFRHEEWAVAVGFVLCGAAIALLWAFAAREFFAQFALALSLAGQVLVVFGLFAMFRRDDWIVYPIFVAFEVVLALAAPYAVHRTWSAFAATVALLFALTAWHVAFLFPALIAAAFVAVELNEAALSRYASISQPVGAGLALGLLLLVPASLAFGMLGDLGGGRPVRDATSALRGSALVAIVFVGTIAVLLVRNRVRLTGRAGLATLAACAALAVAAWQVTALIAALVVVVVSFAAGRRALMGLGFVAIAGTLSHYYYSLDATLLAKSVSLFAAGAVLLAARFAAGRWIAATSSEERHA